LKRGESENKKLLLTALMALTVLSHATLWPFNILGTRAVLHEPALNSSIGNVGDTVLVQGGPGEVGGGLPVYLYWDNVQQWNGYEGLLNATRSDPDGTYAMSFTVPEVCAGKHTLWVKNSYSGETTSASFHVAPSVSLEKIYITQEDSVSFSGTGFGSRNKVTFIVTDVNLGGVPGWPTTSDVKQIGEGNGVKTEWTSVLSNHPVKPGSISVDVDGSSILDQGYGTLKGEAGQGTIDYVSGEVRIVLHEPPASGLSVSLSYEYFEESAELTLLSELITSTEKGKIVGAASFPDLPYGNYTFTAIDSENNTASNLIHISPKLILSKTRVDVGDILHVKGQGFTLESKILQGHVMVYSNIWNGSSCSIYNYPTGGVPVDTENEFSLYLIVPQVPQPGGQYLLSVKDSAGLVSQGSLLIEKTAYIEVKVDSSSDKPKITVFGKNYPNIQGRQVSLALKSVEEDQKINIGYATTDYNGYFQQSFTYSNSAYFQYELVAQADNIRCCYMIQISHLNVELSQAYGAPGDTIKITGTGFTAGGSWSATLNSVIVVDQEDGVVNNRGQLKINSRTPQFSIPQISQGNYTLIIQDTVTGWKQLLDFTVLDDTPNWKTELPQPVFTSPSVLNEEQTIELNGSASIDPDGVILSYHWDFGDGSTSQQIRPIHVYHQDGVYSITLSVRDNNGATAQTTKEIQVNDIDPAPDFKSSKTSGCCPLTIRFTDETIHHDNITLWSWSFGDGGTSTEQNPYHTYSRPGVYTVTLKVVEDDGDESTITKTNYINVYGDDNQPPTNHKAVAWAIGNTITVYAVISDNSNIASAKLLVPGYPDVTLEEHPTKMGLYSASFTVAEKIKEVWLYVKDYNGNQAEANVQVDGEEPVGTTSLSLSVGWSTVSISGKGSASLIELRKQLENFRQIYTVYSEVFPEQKTVVPKITAVWTYDEYRGYLCWDPETGQGEFDQLVGGKQYLFHLEGEPSTVLNVILVYR